ncbi:hypothetical protein JHK87_029048 [Glycine soja]|nr:hypothetical protein JHK87_029048 [Glycine soja]
MSQEQPRCPKDQDPIKYGDVFHVSGNLAKKPVAPEDAAMMQRVLAQAVDQSDAGGGDESDGEGGLAAMAQE